MDANQATDLPIEFYKSWMQVSGAFIAVLIAIIAWYVRSGFSKQEKKDSDQDTKLDTMNTHMNSMFGRLTDAVVSIDKATAVQAERLEQHAKEILKHDKILETLAKTTRR